jgi:hypothetical protein
MMMMQGSEAINTFRSGQLVAPFHAYCALGQVTSTPPPIADSHHRRLQKFKSLPRSGKGGDSSTGGASRGAAIPQILRLHGAAVQVRRRHVLLHQAARLENAVVRMQKHARRQAKRQRGGRHRLQKRGTGGRREELRGRGAWWR